MNMNNLKSTQKVLSKWQINIHYRNKNILLIYKSVFAVQNNRIKTTMKK